MSDEVSSTLLDGSRGPAEPVQAPDTAARLAALLRPVEPPSERTAAEYPADDEAPAPLTFAQQRLWTIDRLSPTGPAYHIATLSLIEGGFSMDTLRRALDNIVRRHPALRTRFAVEAGQVRQVVEAPFPVDLPVWDLSEVDPGSRRAEVERRVRDLAAAQLPLDRLPLFRCALARFGPDRHALAAVFHHITLDGWSGDLLLGEIADAFAGRPAGLDLEGAVRPTLARLARTERRKIEAGDFDEPMRRWKRALADTPFDVTWPHDRPRRAAPDFRGGRVPLAISGICASALEEVAAANGTTLFTVVMAALAIALGRGSGQSRLTIGTPVANRSDPEARGFVGFLANTLPVPIDLSGEPTFTELLARLRRTTLDALSRQEVPFERIATALDPGHGANRWPLFQVMLSLQPGARSDRRVGEISLSAGTVATGSAKFDLTVELERSGAGLIGHIEYARDVYDRGSVERLSELFGSVLSGAADASDRAIRDLVPGTQRSRPLHIPSSRSIYALVAETAQSRPDAIALESTVCAVSYRGLMVRATRYADILRKRSIGPEDLVALCASPSVEAVAAILGVWQIGAAYLAIDPDLPAAAVDEVLSQVPIRATLRDPRVDGRQGAGSTVILGDLAGEAPSETSDPHVSDPRGLAYVIRTSGSTGIPQFVAVPHAGVASLLSWMAANPEGSADGRILSTTALPFDVSVRELFSTLVGGGTVVFEPDLGRGDLAGMARAIDRRRITDLRVVPSLLGLFGDALDGRSDSLCRVFTGGEAVASDAVSRFIDRTGLPVHNYYGPTEASIDVTAMVLQREDAARAVPIGSSVAGVPLHVLDGDLGPVPDGWAGELCVGGLAPARGYLTNAGRTAARFIPDPFGPAGGRLYRTGDLVRRDHLGRLHFIRRLDRQLKVNGVRIEPGEIEAHLLRLPGVGAAYVDVVSASGRSRLAAWVEASGLTSSVGTRLRRDLLGRLPRAAVPDVISVHETLPRGVTGKIDPARLPPLGESSTEPSDPQIALSMTEEMVLEVWSDVLATPVVSGDANFFELGGNSFDAIRASLQLGRMLGREVPAHLSFEAGNAAELARCIDRLTLAGTEDAITRRPTAPEVPTPLSFSQSRLWFLDQLDEIGPTYTIIEAFRLTGPLDRGALVKSLQLLVERHEGLRTSFINKSGEGFQVVGDQGGLFLRSVDLSKVPGDAAERVLQRIVQSEARHQFDLRSEPLLRVTLLQVAPERHDLILGMHHIVSDGWSMMVLVREISALYGMLIQGRPPRLPDLPVQYADFAVWQRRYLTGQVLELHLQYWRRAMAGAPQSLDLPTDHPRPAVQSFRGGRLSFEVDGQTGRRLRALGRDAGATLYMVLVAAYHVLLARYSGERDIVVGTPIANRTRGETDGLIGVFVNTLLIRCRLDDDPSFEVLLDRVRATCVEAYQHQDLPFERLVEELQPPRDLSRQPLFQARFILQNIEVGQIRLGDVTFEPVHAHTATSKFDLTFDIREVDDGLLGYVEYASDLFDRETVERLSRHYVAFLEQVCDTPQTPVLDLPMLQPDEYETIVREWNARPALPAPASIVSMVMAHAEQNSDRVALVSDNRTLTHAGLAARAGRIADGLRREGVGPETRVLLSISDPLEMVVSMLAVLLAGGTYVPVDPTATADRLSTLISECAPLIAVVDPERCRTVDGAIGRALPDLLEDVKACSRWRPDVGYDPQQACYIIFTSGSTGRPKGVAVTHGNLSNYVQWALKTLFGDHPGPVPVPNALNFDLGLTALFPALASGRPVVLVQEDHSTETLAEVLRRERGCSVVKLTPTHLQMLSTVLDAEGLERLVATIVVGGEPLFAGELRRWTEAAPAVRFFNHYGPTEATIGSCATAVAGADLDRHQIPIGRPIDNAQAYVLDDRMAPVALGTIGELYIGGAGVTRGYVGAPGQTAQRFVPDPFGRMSGGRLYRTGDRVRYRADGRLEFVGRADRQEKVRGYRVELGEIEAALLAHPAVDDVAVVTRSDTTDAGHRRLAGYVVPVDDALAVLDSHAAEMLSEKVEVWNQVFETNYDASYADESDDFVGWNSSYTGGPLPRDDMEEWLDATISRIQALSASRILEIGCGIGLLARRLAPHVEQYWCTDFSQHAIDELGRRVARDPALACVRPLCREASDFSGFAPGQFDAIVLNSVIQYFPSAGYLSEVLRGAAGLLKPGGKIFVGDVRHLGLQHCFATDVEIVRTEDEALDCAELRVRASRRLSRENELAVDPAYFVHLADSDPALRVTSIALKRGRHDNEMTCYRYDVVLSKAPGGDATRVESLNWGLVGDGFERVLRDRPPVPVVFRDIPNRRLVYRLRQAHAVDRAANGVTLQHVVAEFPVSARAGSDPEDLIAIAERLGWEAQAIWAASGDLGAFDLLVTPSGSQPQAALPAELVPPRGRHLANDPMFATTSQRLTPVLFDWLRDRLPGYMIPAVLVFLERLPTNANGKLDIRQLPPPEGERPELESAFVSPVMPTEKLLARIWCDVLKLDRVGIEDSFFDLGGDSILLIQVLARIREFGLTVSPRQAFEHQTIAALAQCLGTQTAEDLPISDSGFAPGPVIRRAIALGGTAALDRYQVLELDTALDLSTGDVTELLVAMVQRHPILAVTLENDGSGRIHADIEPGGSMTVRQIDVPVLGTDRHAILGPEIDSLKAELDPRAGRLVGGIWIVTGPEEPNVLIVVINTMVVDWVSWRTLLGDIELAARRQRSGLPLLLPPPTAGYGAWVSCLEAYAASDKALADLEAWLSLPWGMVSGPRPFDAMSANPSVGTPSDGSPGITFRRMPKIRFDAVLARMALRGDVTAEAALLAGVVDGIVDASGKTGFVIDLRGHGRDPTIADLDLSRAIGWFTSVFPVPFHGSGDTDPIAKVNAVDAILRRARPIGTRFGCLRYMGPTATAETLAGLPSASISFNYVGRFEALLEGVEAFHPNIERYHRYRSDWESDYTVEIHAGVSTDGLELVIQYDRARVGAADAEAIGDRTIAVLEQLAAQPGDGRSPASPVGSHIAGLAKAGASTRDLSRLANRLGRGRT